MLIKNGHLLVSTHILRKINTEERSVKFAFHASTIIGRVNVAIKIIEELRQKIIAETQLKDEAGEKLFIDDKKQFALLSDEGNQKLADLMELESEVEIEQFTLEQLEAAGVKIAPANIEHIKWMIK